MDDEHIFALNNLFLINYCSLIKFQFLGVFSGFLAVFLYMTIPGHCCFLSQGACGIVAAKLLQRMKTF